MSQTLQYYALTRGIEGAPEGIAQWYKPDEPSHL